MLRSADIAAAPLRLQWGIQSRSRPMNSLALLVRLNGEKMLLRSSAKDLIWTRTWQKRYSECGLEGLLGLASSEHNGPERSILKRFYTRGEQAQSYGGGGIKPDVVVEQERRPRLVVALLRKGSIFDFAVDFATTQSFPNRFEDYTLPEDIVDQFLDFHGRFGQCR